MDLPDDLKLDDDNDEAGKEEENNADDTGKKKRCKNLIDTVFSLSIQTERPEQMVLTQIKCCSI